MVACLERESPHIRVLVQFIVIVEVKELVPILSNPGISKRNFCFQNGAVGGEAKRPGSSGVVLRAEDRPLHSLSFVCTKCW